MERHCDNAGKNYSSCRQGHFNVECAQLKLPLFMHSPHLCDSKFKDDHTRIIKKFSLSGKVLAVCTGCGIEWEGNYKNCWMPRSVGLALMGSYTGILLKKIYNGFVFQEIKAERDKG